MRYHDLREGPGHKIGNDMQSCNPAHRNHQIDSMFVGSTCRSFDTIAVLDWGHYGVTYWSKSHQVLCYLQIHNGYYHVCSMTPKLIKVLDRNQSRELSMKTQAVRIAINNLRRKVSYRAFFSFQMIQTSLLMCDANAVRNPCSSFYPRILVPTNRWNQMICLDVYYLSHVFLISSFAKYNLLANVKVWNV